MKKQIVFGIFIGIIIGVSATVFASQFSAKQISYTPSDSTWDVKNVEEAITDLKENNSNANLEKLVIANDIVNNGSYQTKTYTDNVEKGKYYVISGGGGGLTSLSYRVTASNAIVTEVNKKIMSTIVSGSWYGGLYTVYKVEAMEDTQIVQTVSASFGAVDNVFGYTIIKG